MSIYNKFLKTIVSIEKFLWQKIEPITSRDDLIGTITSLILAISFLFLFIYIFNSIVIFFNSYIGEVIWKLMTAPILIFITGYYALSIIPGPYLSKNIFNFSFKKIRTKISRIRIESLISSPLRTILSFFLFGLMFYIIWDLIYWMLTGFEITWNDNTYSPEPNYYEDRMHRRR